jgi:hypothetical protein
LTPGQITVERSGSRKVELLIPFDFMGLHIDAITLGPIVLDHTMRWREAMFPSWFELMVEVSVVCGKPASAEYIRQLRYPDADRVRDSFMEILPSEIRNAIDADIWPQKVPKSAATNGRQAPQREDMPAPMPAPVDEEQRYADPMNIDN